MTDFDNNKEKHTVCTVEIRRKGLVGGFEWDSWGWHPCLRELSVSGRLQQSAIKKLASVYHRKTFACNSTSISGLGITVPPSPPERGTAS